jgi:hypothetical protein
VSEFLYKLFTRLSRAVGLWPIRLTAIAVATFYFLFFARRRAHSIRFYRALFPERSRWFALACTWRQYQDFARI